MKKSIGVIFFFNSLLIPYHASSQSCDTFPYQHIYYNQGFHDTKVKSFSVASNKDVYLIGYVNQYGEDSNADAWMMRATSHGTPLWSKAIGTGADETVNSIRNLSDKTYLIAGSTKYNSINDNGWLAKIDSSGNPIWSLELQSANGSLNQVENLDNGDFVVAGTLYLKFNGGENGNAFNVTKSSNFLMRFDNNGKIIWQRSFQHNNLEALKRVQQISDGNLIATGIVVDSSIGYILKIDQHTGNIIWMNQYEITDNSNYANIKENNDKTLEFKTGSNVYYFTADVKLR